MTEEPTESSAARYREAAAAKPDWAAWLKENGPRLLLYARQQTRCEADAEDVMQEALVQLVRSVEGGSFVGGSDKWASYTYSAIRHLATDRGRREDSQQRQLAYLGEQMALEGYSSPWLEAAENDSGLRDQVEALLRSLPPEFAEVVVLRIWGEYSFQQIADMTGTKASTVTSRYRYAMQALRKKLKHNPITP